MLLVYLYAFLPSSYGSRARTTLFASTLDPHRLARTGTFCKVGRKVMWPSWCAAVTSWR